jgi:hypothetical protein
VNGAKAVENGPLYPPCKGGPRPLRGKPPKGAEEGSTDQGHAGMKVPRRSLMRLRMRWNRPGRGGHGAGQAEQEVRARKRSRMRANRPGRGAQSHGAEPTTTGGPGGGQPALPGGPSPQPARPSPTTAPSTTHDSRSGRYFFKKEASSVRSRQRRAAAARHRGSCDRLSRLAAARSSAGYRMLPRPPPRRGLSAVKRQRKNRAPPWKKSTRARVFVAPWPARAFASRALFPRPRPRRRKECRPGKPCRRASRCRAPRP